MPTNFFPQLIARLLAGNPAFFKIIQGAAFVLGLVSAAFHYLDTQHTALPCWLLWLENSIVWVSALVAMVIAQLPNVTANDTSNNLPKKSP